MGSADYKVQVSLSVGGVMINIPAETDEEASKRAVDWLARANTLAEGIEKIKANTRFSPAGLTNKQVDPQNLAECGLCGGDVWDNRAKKASPKSPDFRCKSCNAAGWEKKGGGVTWKKSLK